MAAQRAVMLDTAVGAQKVVVADGGAGAKVAERHDYIAFTPCDVHANDATGVDDIGKRDATALPQLEDTRTRGNAGADGYDRCIELPRGGHVGGTLDVDRPQDRHAGHLLAVEGSIIVQDRHRALVGQPGQCVDDLHSPVAAPDDENTLRPVGGIAVVDEVCDVRG